MNNVIPRQNVKLLQWCGLVNIFTYTFLDALSAYTWITNLWSAFLEIPTRDSLSEANGGLFHFNLMPPQLLGLDNPAGYLSQPLSFSLHPVNRKSRKNISTSFLTMSSLAP